MKNAMQCSKNSEFDFLADCTRLSICPLLGKNLNGKNQVGVRMK